MKTSSKKAKGRNLQKLVRDCILKIFPKLTARDVKSTSMGKSGADIELSEAAFELFGYDVECKSLARVSVYKFYNQRDKAQGERLVVVKQNNSQPLAIISLDHFMELVKCQNKTSNHC